MKIKNKVFYIGKIKDELINLDNWRCYGNILWLKWYTSMNRENYIKLNRDKILNNLYCKDIMIAVTPLINDNGYAFYISRVFNYKNNKSIEGVRKGGCLYKESYEDSLIEGIMVALDNEDKLRKYDR